MTATHPLQKNFEKKIYLGRNVNERNSHKTPPPLQFDTPIPPRVIKLCRLEQDFKLHQSGAGL